MSEESTEKKDGQSKSKDTIYKHASDAGFTIEEIESMITIMSKTISDYDDVISNLEEQQAMGEALKKAIIPFLKEDETLENRLIMGNYADTIKEIKMEFAADMGYTRSAIDKLKILKIMCT